MNGGGNGDCAVSIIPTPAVVLPLAAFECESLQVIGEQLEWLRDVTRGLLDIITRVNQTEVTFLILPDRTVSLSMRRLLFQRVKAELVGIPHRVEYIRD